MGKDVTKGYSSKHVFDYKEIFSSIVMLKSIKVLLSIMMHSIMMYVKWMLR